MDLSPIKTLDGSITLKDKELNETYHSLDGALSESEYVFIEQGLKKYSQGIKGKVRVLELGFGMGYNSFLALKFAVKHSLQISILSCETQPIEPEILRDFGVFEAFSNEDRKLFEMMHFLPWEDWNETEAGMLKKTKASIKELDLNSEKGFDLVFFDAFAPSKQPDVWDPEILEKCAGCLKEGGSLITYCAQGQFKRDLASKGFQVSNPPGFGKKREMTLGIKN